jgi:leucyl aminopeptidase
MLKITFVSAALPTQGALVLTVAADRKPGPAGVELDRKLGGVLRRAMAASAFKGDKAQTLVITAPARTRLSRIVLVGLGRPGNATDLVLEHVGSAALTALQGGRESYATLFVDDHKGMALQRENAAAQAALGARLRSYRFDKYRTKLKPDQKPALKTLAIAGNPTAVKQAWHALEKIADGVFLTRDLVSEPANAIYPETLAEQCRALEKPLGHKCGKDQLPARPLCT